jgi:hypothetical protein
MSSQKKKRKASEAEAPAATDEETPAEASTTSKADDNHADPSSVSKPSRNRRIVSDSQRDSKAVKGIVARQHYEDYFWAEHKIKKAWASMSYQDFDMNNVERFATYLCKKVDITSSNTVCGYLSAIRGSINEHNNGGIQHNVVTNDKHWKKINKHVKAELSRKAVTMSDGKGRATKKAEPITLGRLDGIMLEFFKVSTFITNRMISRKQLVCHKILHSNQYAQDSTTKHIHDRFMFCMQFQIIGRPYELGFIRFQDLGWIDYGDSPTGTVDVFRTKVYAQSTLKMFAAPIGFKYVSWAADIFHAAGTYFVLMPGGFTSNDLIFRTSTRVAAGTAKKKRRTMASSEAMDDSMPEESDIGTSGVAAYMNAALRSSKFATELKDQKKIASDLTSYGSRRGAATHLAQFSCMKTVGIAHRGGWALDSTDTVLEYITGTDEEDSKAGQK